MNGMPATVYYLVPREVEVSPFGWMTVVMDRPVGGISAFALNVLISAPVSRIAVVLVSAV